MGSLSRLGSTTLLNSILVIATLMAGCASFMGDDTTGYRDITLSAGGAPAHDVYVKTARILNRHMYETVRQEESSQMLYFETRWRYREPFEDEQAQGITAARTRLMVQARPRLAAVAAGGSNLYRVQIVAENMVRLADSQEWVRIPNSKMYTTYIRQIARDLEIEFRLSIRKF